MGRGLRQRAAVIPRAGAANDGITFEADGQTALVPSSDGNHTYRVTATSCTCTDFAIRRHRNPDYKCKHIRRVALLNAAPVNEFAQEAAPAAAAPNGVVVAPPPPRLTTPYMEEAEWIRALCDEFFRMDRERKELAARRITLISNWLQRNGGNPRFSLYLAPYEEFLQFYNWVIEHRPEYQTTIGLGTRTFGVELETFGNTIERVRELLHRANLNNWQVKVDTSIKETDARGRQLRTGTFGTAEINSPVLRDTPQCWQELERVCTILRDNGSKVNFSCGLHVHFGAHGDFDTNIACATRLGQLVQRFEPALYRAGRAERSDRDLTYCKSVRSIDYERRYPSIDAFWRTWYKPHAIDHTDRRQILNLKNLGGRDPGGHAEGPNTIEFRHCNGTLDPVIIQSEVRILGALTNLAADTTRELPPKIELSEGAADAEHSQFRFLMDVAFPKATDALDLGVATQRQRDARAATTWLYARGNLPPEGAQ